MKQVGRGVPGLPNRQLVSGHGTFVADITLPEMCAMAVLRSPYAAARILSIETARAMAEPGVLYVLTGEEIEREGDFFVGDEIPSGALQCVAFD